MKKRTKIALWTALFCILIGSLLWAGGVVAGGLKQLDQISIHGDGLWDSLLQIDGDEAVEKLLEDAGYFQGAKKTAGQKVYNGDFTLEIPAEKLAELDLEIGIHSLEITTATVDKVTIEGKNCDQIQCYQKENTLEIKDVGKKKTADKERQIKVVLPESVQWQEAEIEAAMAKVTADVLNARKVQLKAGMGNIEIENLTADEADIEADMGNVIVENFDIRDLDISADMGAVEMEGKAVISLDAEANMGAVELKLHQAFMDFNYEIDASMGTVVVDGESYSSLKQERVINNTGANGRMELEASMGSIEICFE